MVPWQVLFEPLSVNLIKIPLINLLLRSSEWRFEREGNDKKGFSYFSSFHLVFVVQLDWRDGVGVNAEELREKLLFNAHGEKHNFSWYMTGIFFFDTQEAYNKLVEGIKCCKVWDLSHSVPHTWLNVTPFWWPQHLLTPHVKPPISLDNHFVYSKRNKNNKTSFQFKVK